MELQLKKLKLKLERQSRCTLRTRRVRRKSSAKIDQSSNQSNRFNLRGKCKGCFFLLLSYFLFFVRATLRQVALNRGASRRVVFRSVLSGGNQWEFRLARINKFNILSADTKFCFCHFYGIAYTEKMICCCFLFAFFLFWLSA